MDVETARRSIAAEPPPRRLRLDELLREVGARDTGAPGPPAGADTGPRDAITVGVLVDHAERSGFGFLIGVLALIAIPFVGLSTPFGLAIALIGAQMVAGRRHPWLPRRARRRELAMAMLDRVLGLIARRAHWLTRLSHRRWDAVIRTRLIGLGIVLLALGLALPLPIPGSNLVFLIPLFIYALGLLECDGAWIVVGHLCVAIDLALLAVFGTTVVHAVERMWHWVAG